MKKLLALVLALMMALSCFAALAEESAQAKKSAAEISAITVTEEIDLNEEAVMALLPMFGFNEAGAAMVQPIVSLLDNLGCKAVLDDSGVQFDLNLKGQSVLTLAAELNETGVAVATDVLPSYVLAMSYETIQGILELSYEAYQEMLAESYETIDWLANELVAEFDKAFAGVDFEKIAENVTAYENQYVDACMSAVTMGETQVGEFYIEANDYTFNTCTPINVDVKAISEAMATLTEQLKNDKALGTLFAALENMGAPVNLNGEETAAEQPKVEGWLYANVDEKGNSVDGVTYIVFESSYADAPENDFDVQLLMNENGIMFTIFVPALDADVVLAVSTNENEVVMVIETEVQEMYIAAEATMSFGDTINLDCDLFFMDPEKPILCEKTVIAFEGERTFTVLDENKAVVDVTTLMADETGEVSSALMMDVMGNGLNGLLAKAAQIMPDEVTAIMNLFMGAEAVEEAAE